MKRALILTLLALGLSAVGGAQGFLNISTVKTITDTAQVTWDSNAVGPKGSPKSLEVLNEGSVALFVSIGNDTATGRYAILKQNEKLRIERLSPEKYFIRAKSASSTAIYRITIGR